MVRVLFWNINKKPLAEELRQLCEIHDVDILVLAESDIPAVDVLSILNRETERTFTSPYNLSQRISFFSRFHGNMFGLVSDNGYCSIRTIMPPLGPDTLQRGGHACRHVQTNCQERDADSLRTRASVFLQSDVEFSRG